MWVRNRTVMVMSSVLFTAGCAASAITPSGREAARDAERAAAIAALAAPGQNVASARLLPQDNCYWYEHTGPVETTLLPLVNVDGQPICLQSKT